MNIKGNRLNLLVGIAATGLISAFAIDFLLNEYRRPAFSPDNAWLWFSLLSLIPLGFIIALLGMLRRTGCGYFIWSQLVLAFLVSLVYFGWYRRELDYVKMGPDPEALDQGPPIATLFGLTFLLITWVLIGFMPLALRQLIRWYRARKSRIRENAAVSSQNEREP
ncbi:MAG: hypothetical protein EG825_11140 [Rhodocyclaceae bacterium]|nr:hypothetical protein [Rhodocyclaceae bacterium]